jgi:hypothetical protein
MRHLIDDREPITTADIDQAVRDGSELLAAFTDQGGAVAAVPDRVKDVLERLHAIVLDAYGYEAASDD